VSFDGNGETDQRDGFHVGVYGESFISDSFLSSLRCILQQGYIIKSSNSTFTQKLDYINLPVMLKAYPSKKLFRSWTSQV
jgi:hypothetical protein